MSVRISIIMNDDHYSSDKLNSELYCSGLLAPSAGFTYLDNKVLWVNLKHQTQNYMNNKQNNQ